MRDKLRRVILRPYRKGHGPAFILDTFATERTDWRGQTRIAYTLKMRENGRSVVLFEGVDFAGSPMHADDSSASVASLLGFLTLRPGDTDAEYFEKYTPGQLAYCNRHAETLACYVADRFGEL